ncbi:MAG: 3-hydroxybutyryl-CoA dehydrogenase [archaeon]|nr:3-hydroxybutyryl-CoA dehydrogenase [archaeon]
MTRVGVIGAGAMGHGIAQVFAQGGFNVKLNDVSLDFINSGIRKIEANLSRSVEKGKMSEDDKKAALSRVLPTASLDEFKDREFVVEAVLEKIEVKRDVFKKLDRICGRDTVLASNTSSIPITELAALVSNPQRVAGMHFFNPVPVMKLIEIVQALQTSISTIEIIRALSLRLGKTPVVVKDNAGFVSNRVVCPMINEAIFAYEQGIASKEDIDTVMKLGMNHPMGPLELADFVGLDIVLDVLDVLYREYEDPKYRASPLLRNMVRAGYLGRKTKKGFYEYP